MASKQLLVDHLTVLVILISDRIVQGMFHLLLLENIFVSVEEFFSYGCE